MCLLIYIEILKYLLFSDKKKKKKIRAYPSDSISQSLD